MKEIDQLKINLNYSQQQVFENYSRVRRIEEHINNLSEELYKRVSHLEKEIATITIIKKQDNDKFTMIHKINCIRPGNLTKIELPNGDYVEILYNDKYLYFENHIMEYDKTYTLDGYPVRFTKV